MLRIVFRAIASLVGTILLASSAIFLLIHLSGDPTYGFLPADTSPEMRAAIRERLGLDDALWKQYGRFIADPFTLDFGYSWNLEQPADEAILRVLPMTALLAAIGSVAAVAVGVVSGVVSSRRRRGISEWMISASTLAGLAIPGFWLGTLLILVFSVRLGWVPPSGSDGWRTLILPAVTLTVHPASMIARLVRANIRDNAGASYIRTAHAKGLSQPAIRWTHVLPNALMPALAYVGVHAAALIGGVIVVESVFAYPGVGRMALQAALARDMPVIHAFVVFSTLLVVAINLAVDVIAHSIDPRMRSSHGGEHAG
jgi:ABC-type dipeptide/oligopeptide/nickel transport system permease component